MRAKRKIVIGLMMILLLTLAGCGSQPKAQKPGTIETNTNEVSASEFIKKMIVAADGAVVTRSDCNVVFDTFVEINNQIFESRKYFSTHNQYDTENGFASAEINVKSEQDDYVSCATYNLVDEQGVLYYYAFDEYYGWIKHEACLEKEEISRNFVSSMNLNNAEVLSFETEGVQYNGQNVYKLSLVLKDADIRELVFESGLKYLFWAREYATIDLSDITVTMDYYVDPESAQVLKAEARLEGMQSLIKAWVDLWLGSDVQELYQEEQLKECVLVYDNISYEDYTLPKMSFEDKKSSVLIHQKDTVYTISTLTAEVEVICPAGWCVGTEEGEYINFYRADGLIDIWYILEYYMTPEEYLAGEIPLDVEDDKSWGEYVSDRIGPELDGFDTYEIVLKEGVHSLAYTPIGNDLLIIEVIDYTSSRLDKSLPEVLERVQWEE